ncbi:unnamed protein product [Camellia sinensis]
MWWLGSQKKEEEGLQNQAPCRAFSFLREYFPGSASPDPPHFIIHYRDTEIEQSIMSFLFFKPSRPKTPQELVKAIKDCLTALDAKTVAKVQALKKALEEVEKNFATMRVMLYARKDLVHCWSILLKQKGDSTYCCVQYLENHLELLDFLVVRA